MSDHIEQARCVAPRFDGPGRICQQSSPALASHGMLCTGHDRRLTQLLAEIGPVRSLVITCITPTGAQGTGDKVSGSKVPPAPLNITALDLADRIGDIVALWASLVADERHLTAGTSMDQHTRLLTRQYEWIVGQSWAGDLLEELADVTRRAHQLIPWTLGRTHLPYRCPHCAGLTVYRNDGEDGIWCDQRAGGCGAYGLEARWADLIGQQTA